MDGVDASCVEEDALREGGLARVYVGRDADVAEVAQLIGVVLCLCWLCAEAPASLASRVSHAVQLGCRPSLPSVCRAASSTG